MATTSRNRILRNSHHSAPRVSIKGEPEKYVYSFLRKNGKLGSFDNSPGYIVAAGERDWRSGLVDDYNYGIITDRSHIRRVRDVNFWFLTRTRFLARAYYDVLENERV